MQNLRKFTSHECFLKDLLENGPCEGSNQGRGSHNQRTEETYCRKRADRTLRFWGTGRSQAVTSAPDSPVRAGERNPGDGLEDGCIWICLSWLLAFCLRTEHPGEPAFSFNRSVISDSLWPPVDCSLCRLLCPWDSPGKNTGVCCPFLLQGIFLTQGSSPWPSL